MKISALSLFVGATLLLTSTLGCDAIKGDLSTYSKTAVPVYNTYSEKFGAKMDEGSKAANQKEYVAITKETITLLDEFRAKMEAIKPETKEVQDLNQSCVTNLTNLEDGLKQMLDALEKHDQALAQTAKAKIEDAVKADEKFRYDLKALEDQHHVQVQP